MFTKRSCLPSGLLVLGLVSCGLWGCSSSDGGGAQGGQSSSGSASASSSGGSSSAKSSSGGSSANAGSVSSGGASSSASSSEVGGSSGGKSTEISSSSSGGAGGSSKGGNATGGTSKGGASGGGTAGNATGGAATGGSSAGGAATGGAATGGTTKGGATTGGTSATGGAATGGSATGGSGTGGGTGTTPGGGSPGCGIASPLKSGTFTEKINNVDRQWILDVPSGYDNTKPTRLIFVWHPLGGSASQVANGYNGLKALSNNSTIFVAPNGLNGKNSEASGNGWWNVDDVDMKFLEAMLKKLNENLCIDQSRIFTTGFSFGGMMSYTTPFVFNVFRATAPCSGKSGVIPYTSKVNDPIPIMAFHGTNDNVCALSLAKDFFQKFLTRNKCGTETKAVDPSPCVQYQGCTVPTIWCQFSGGHEQWSGESQAIWNFFKQY